MNRRLQQFLAAENISQSQFADTIGVARASVSHILAGRNKPGFDFIESMSRNYPDVNLEWLITGKGKMFKTMTEASYQKVSPSQKPAQSDRQADDLFADFDEEEIAVTPSKPQAIKTLPIEQPKLERPVSTPASAPAAPVQTYGPATETKKKPSATIALEETSKAINNQRNILKIIVFYDDNTYQELK